MTLRAQKRKRKGIFKIPRVPSKTPTPQKNKDHEKELFDKDKLIENLRRQLNEQLNSKTLEDPKKPGNELTPAQKKVIDKSNSRAQILQPEKHYSEDYNIWHKVVPYLHMEHPF